MNFTDKTSAYYTSIGVQYYEQKNYPLALQSFEEALKILDYGQEVNELLHSEPNKDDAFSSALDDSFTSASMEEESKARTPPRPNDIDKKLRIAELLSNLGSVLIQTNRADIALEILQHAFEIKKEYLWKGDRGLAETLNNVGNAYVLLGKQNYAMKSYDKALRVWKYNSKFKNTTKDVMLRADTLHNIGSLYMLREEWDDALITLKEALRVSKAVLGPMHLNVADTMEKIGTIYIKQENYDLALESLLQVKRIVIKCLGENHIDVSSCFFNIATVLIKMDRLKKGHEKLIEAINICKMNGMGDDNPSVIAILKALSDSSLRYSDNGENEY